MIFPVAAASACFALFASAVAEAASSTPEAASAIAHRIATGTPQEADAAMAEAFGWAGASTVDGAGKTVTKAIAPTIPVTMRSFEMRRAVVSARGPTVTTLAEIAEKLVEMGAFAPPALDTSGLEAAGEAFRKKLESGTPLSEEDLAEMARSAENVSSGFEKQLEGVDGKGFLNALDADLAALALQDVLRRLIVSGRANPTNVHAFVPLFLEAFAKERATREGAMPVDLVSTATRPEDIELTLTEAHLFALMFLRGRTSYATAPVRYASLGMPLLGAAPPRGTPCSDYTEKMGNYGKAMEAAGGKAGEAAQDVAQEILDEYVSKGGQKLIGYAAQAFRILTMIIDAAEWELTSDQPASHYAHSKGSPVEVTINAKVTLPPPGNITNAEAIDCLKTGFGFDLPATTEQMVKTMKDWKVYWELDGLGGHAAPSETKNTFKYHAPLGGQLEISGHTGRTKLVLDMTLEDEKADKQGKQRKGTIRVTANLDQSAAIDPSILLTAVSDLPAALVQVFTEWAKKLTPKKATTVVKASWHEPKIFAWEGTITQVTTLSGTRDLTEKTSGRAPPAIAIGQSIAAPSDGTEVFHDEGTATRTVTVKLTPGHEGERIHKYTFVSKDHALSTRKESTPEVCIRPSGAFDRGVWKTDIFDSIDIAFEGAGFTTTVVKFDESDGTYYVESPIPYASGWMETASKYEGKTSCGGGGKDPTSYPMTRKKIFGKIDYRLVVHGKAKADAKVLAGTITEPIDATGPLGTKGSIKTTWALKKTVVEWSGE